MALSLLWHKILQVPKPKLSRMQPNHPIWWKSRPVSIQKVSAGPDPWIHGPWVHTTASPLATNQDKWKSKCYTPDCKSNTGREATNSTTNFQHICLCKISLGHRSQGNKSAALRFFSNTSRIQHLSCTLVLCDSDGCRVASRVQLKHQIVSWGLHFPFLLIFWFKGT